MGLASVRSGRAFVSNPSIAFLAHVQTATHSLVIPKQGSNPIGIVPRLKTPSGNQAYHQFAGELRIIRVLTNPTALNRLHSFKPVFHYVESELAAGVFVVALDREAKGISEALAEEATTESGLE